MPRCSQTGKPLLTVFDIAEICRVNEKTVRRWINAGSIPALTLGRQYRIRPADLNAFLRTRQFRKSG